MSLKQTLQENGVESSMLDDLVHEAACRIASRTNNEGISEQLDFLENSGYSKDNILSELGIN